MSKRESSVYDRLKERITMPPDRFERVENGLGAGMPDVNYCIVGAEGWIEIKAPVEPARPQTALFGASNHNVTVEQCNWLLKQSQAGGTGWLFIATEQRLMLIDGAIVGRMGIAVNKKNVFELERMAAWRVLLPLMDQLRWADLRQQLSYHGKVPK